jgi:fucose permease
MSALGVPLLAHFGVVAALSGVVLVWGGVRLLTGTDTAAGAAQAEAERERALAGDGPASVHPAESASGPAPEAPPAQPARRRGAARAWTEKRTMLIGLVVLGMTLAEGGANDWLASAVVQGFHAPESVGIVGLGIFLVAMTLMRIAGTRIIDRWGRVRALRFTATLAFTGLAVFGLAPWLPVALVGAALWGLGSALAFPLGMSAAGDEPAHAAQRTAVVATIAYGAFMAGPPILGMIANVIGFRHALLVIILPVTLVLALAAVVTPLGDGER